MINFRNDQKVLEKIVNSLGKLSRIGLHEFFTDILKDNLNHSTDVYDSSFRFSSHIATFRFDEAGRPFTKFGKGLSILTVDIEHMNYTKYQYKYILRMNQCIITIITMPKSSHKINQIYLTITLDKPDYQVIALGRNFNIDPDKHPELFLADDELSYAYLLGQKPLVGLPQYLSLLQPIVAFIADTCVIVDERIATKAQAAHSGNNLQFN